MWIVVGQPHTAKSPSIRCAIDDPMKKLPKIQGLIRTSITAGGFSTALEDYSHRLAKSPSISIACRCQRVGKLRRFVRRVQQDGRNAWLQLASQLGCFECGYFGNNWLSYFIFVYYCGTTTRNEDMWVLRSLFL